MRKPINKDNCIEVGYIKKTHGIKGELNISLNEDLISDLSELDFMFFKIDGLLVPFFVEETWGEGQTIAKFKLIENKEKANEFVGCKLFLDRSEIQANEEELNPSVLVGFTLIDETEGEIGKITEVNDYGGNLVLTIDYNSTEVMVPYNEDLVTGFNFDEQILEMDCPEGLFNIEDV